MELLRLVKVHSLAELRGIAESLARVCEAILMPSKLRYIFNPASTAADDDFLVIAPNDSEVGCCRSGRWELEVTSISGGGGGGGGGGSPLVILEAEDTTTSGAGSGAYQDLGTATLTFVLAATTDVFILGHATSALDFANRTDVQIGVNVDGTDYNGNFVASGPLGNFIYGALTVVKKLTLAAGSHTVTLRARGLNGFNCGVASSATFPTRLEVLY